MPRPSDESTSPADTDPDRWSAKALASALRRHFGHRRFRPGQEQVIRTLLAGRPALAVFPTGGGKSACYQLPALLLPGSTLVVSPLIALMRDQVEALRARGLAAARLDSTLPPDEAAEVIRQWSAGELRLLYVAPERLAGESFRQLMQRHPPALLAIDEAHCISEWGHHFRPDYLKLAPLAHAWRLPRVLALTATATPAVATDIRRAFGIAEADHVQLSFHRPNLQLTVEPCADGRRLDRLRRELERTLKRPGSAVVYVTRQETAAMVAAGLERGGVAARAYHAGLPAALRAETQAGFMAGNLRVIVATIAFGMGIDKPDIRLVVHYNMPKSLENYSQEIGRAGRDGRRARCLWLACADDLTVLENFIYGDTPTPQAVRNLLDHVLRLGPRFDLSVHDLSTACDMRLAVVETLLTYLELEGVIEAGRRFHAEYKIHLLQPLERILAGRGQDERRLLAALLTAGREGRRWRTLQLTELAEPLGRSLDELDLALGWLGASGDAEVRPTRPRQSYRRLQEVTGSDLQQLAGRLHRRCLEREQRELQRLHQVLELARLSSCLTAALTAHFGETLAAPCGHCDRCRRPSKVRPLTDRAAPAVSDSEVGQVRQLAAEAHPALRTARQRARFLCGLPSPAATRARLQRDDRYGLLAKLPFATVLELCEAIRA